MVTNAEARFNNSLCPRKPEGSLGRTAQDGHLDSHTAPELFGEGSGWAYNYMTRSKRLLLFMDVDTKAKLMWL